MKKYPGLLLAALLGSWAQVAESAPKEDVVLWYDAFANKDPALLDRILDPSWVDIPAPSGAPAGPEGAKNILKQLSATFPDLTIVVEDVIQEGSKVVVRSEISGTQQGEFLGRSGTGGRLVIQAIDIHEFRHGKIVRTWHTEDWMTGLHQLGVLGN